MRGVATVFKLPESHCSHYICVARKFFLLSKYYAEQCSNVPNVIPIKRLGGWFAPPFINIIASFSQFGEYEANQKEKK